MLDTGLQNRVIEVIKKASTKEIFVRDIVKILACENDISAVRAFLKTRNDIRYTDLNDSCSYRPEDDAAFIERAKTELYNFYHRNEYINFTQASNLISLYPKSVFYLFNPLGEPIANNNATRLLEPIDLLEQWRKIHNEQFISRELENQKSYFDSVLPKSLDAQQRLSIVTNEDNNLVVASAGSGKTTTIIGKVRYLIDQCGVAPKDILVLTYTKVAAEELRQRIGRKDVDCLTFHSHACKTLRIKEIDEHFFERVFDDMMEEKSFFKAANKYLTIYSNLWKYDYEYASAKERTRALAQFNIAPYPDKDGYRMYVRSKEELELCVILTELGLSIRYEEGYEFASKENGRYQYKPDFTIYYKDASGVETKAYLEHFGIDNEKHVPKWFGDGKEGGYQKAEESYNKWIEKKRETHKLNGTTLIETTSGEFQTHKGNMREFVLAKLVEKGIPIHPISEAQKMELLEKVSFHAKDKLRVFLEGYVTLLKVHQYTTENIDKIEIKLTQTPSWYRERNLFIWRELVKPIFDRYNQKLAEKKLYDFTDVLYKCIRSNKEFGLPRKYKYILVDEYQDMSEDKYEYLKSWRSQDPFTRIFCVGDDWQSIYRFAGSDLSYFNKFAEHFIGRTVENKIEQTHRFGNPLAKISSHFILQNAAQKEKQVIPKDIETAVEAIKYTDGQQRYVLKQIISQLQAGEEQDEEKGRIRILLLARYWKSFKSVLGFNIQGPTDHIIGNHKVKCMTIHSAKGLTADNVVIIDCNSGTIPSVIQDDPMLSCVLADSDTFEYAEERRLFYVALTRATKKTILLYDQYAPSCFIEELGFLKNNSSSREHCPWCDNGTIMVGKPRVARNSGQFVNIYCSNYDEHLCDYTETIFADSAEEKFKHYISLNKKE
ncbi:MAG: UvrD-helicase domain-containing protein [Paludibacteraceae bacterium]|nr:UvrD-helicase domain-containing protein [Paludibacteraceae bacterium]